MIRKFYFLLVTFIIGSSTLLAQTEEAPTEKLIFYRPTLAIKFVPMALIARTPAIQFAVEAKTFKDQAVQLEYGYIANYFARPDTDFKGHKLKTEYRFYWLSQKEGKHNNFVGLQHMYKNVKASGTTPVWRNDMTYQEIIPVEVVNQTHSIYLLIGKTFPFSERFFMELALGLGSKKLKVTIDGLPEDAELNRDLGTTIFSAINTPGTYSFPDLFVSLKFNYVFGNHLE